MIQRDEGESVPWMNENTPGSQVSFNCDHKTTQKSCFKGHVATRLDLK